MLQQLLLKVVLLKPWERLPGAIGIDNDDKIPGLKRLAEAIQSKGSKAILQLYHAGRMANLSSMKVNNPYLRVLLQH